MPHRKTFTAASATLSDIVFASRWATTTAAISSSEYTVVVLVRDNDVVMQGVPGCGHAAGVLRTLAVSFSGKYSVIFELAGEVEKCRWLVGGVNWSWWTTTKLGRSPTLDRLEPPKALISWADARLEAIEPHDAALVEIIGSRVECRYQYQTRLGVEEVSLWR